MCSGSALESSPNDRASDFQRRFSEICDTICLAWPRVRRVHAILWGRWRLLITSELTGNSDARNANTLDEVLQDFPTKACDGKRDAQNNDANPWPLNQWPLRLGIPILTIGRAITLLYMPRVRVYSFWLVARARVLNLSVMRA